MKKILQKLFEQQVLDRKEAKKILGQISEGKFNEYQVASFLTVFKMRSITVEELSGFSDCLKERCNKIDFSDFDIIDLCGTGGDGKDTFNISTLASFVVAGAGYKVAKHGNYGVSSVCGSSNVLESLGYNFTVDPDKLKNQLSNCNITFLHAPLFHPAMKEVAPIRKKLGLSTFFNMLGPMVNPSFPKNQLVGVFSLQLQRYYKYIYETQDVSYRIVHSLDGYDELSLTGKAKVISPTKEYLFDPKEEMNISITSDEILGGTSIDEAKNIFKNIISGNGTAAQNAVVCSNAALAIQCFNPSKTFAEAREEASESLNSKKALHSLNKLLSI